MASLDSNIDTHFFDEHFGSEAKVYDEPRNSLLTATIASLVIAGGAAASFVTVLAMLTNFFDPAVIQGYFAMGLYFVR